MKACSCGGELLRHGITKYKDFSDLVGVRYKCCECGKTFTQRMSRDEHRGLWFFHPTGRPTIRDWRFAE